MKIEENLKVNKEEGVQIFKTDEISIEIKGLTDKPFMPLNKFKDILSPSLLTNIQEINYLCPTEVQKYSIPIIFQGHDLISCAQTGSGKTAAFLLPIINQLANRPFSRAERVRASPKALILSPTRELALQIYEEALKFSFNCHLRSYVVYGGESIHLQINQFNRGDCDILVATPGRLIDLHRRGKVRFNCLKFLVLDEADRMLDMGFEPQITELLYSEDMPLPDQRQTLMFSATFPTKIRVLAKKFMREYVWLSVKRLGCSLETIRQKVEWVSEDQKLMYLIDVLSIRIDELKLVFVKTKQGASQLETLLKEKGFLAISIHGDKSQWEREEALTAFKNGVCPVLIATSVVARGLDVSNIKTVVNYDLPANLDDYIHRIGRTGRAGNVGEAISFFNEKDLRLGPLLSGFLIDTGQEIPSFLVKNCTSWVKEENLVNRKEVTYRALALSNQGMMIQREEIINGSNKKRDEIDWFDII